MVDIHQFVCSQADLHTASSLLSIEPMGFSMPAS